MTFWRWMIALSIAGLSACESGCVCACGRYDIGRALAHPTMTTSSVASDVDVRVRATTEGASSGLRAE